MKLYVAGPMTGFPAFNYPLFHCVADALEGAGYEVLNPAGNKPMVDAPRWSDYMRMAVKQVADADGLAMLPGWEKSAGASLEVKLCTDLGMEHRAWWRWVEEAPELRAGADALPGTIWTLFDQDIRPQPLPSIDPYDNSWARSRIGTTLHA